jgi:RimJ/RimL family protein N-acetyltransferase
MLPLWIFLKDDPTRIVGKVVLSQIVRGVFHSCFLGYKLDGALQGRGYATEAVRRVMDVAFHELRLHRIEAHVIPRNVRSVKLLERLGFQAEGYGPKYLKIHGIWEDHLHFAFVKGAGSRSASETHSPNRARGLALHGERTMLRLATEADVPALVEYRERNRDRIDRWNPTMAEVGRLEESTRKRVLQSTWLFEAGREADFVVCLPDRPASIVGSLTFREITPMPLSSSELGFTVDALVEGRGYMHDACRTGLRFMFDVFGLHRATASYMVENERSGRLLEVLGFQKEGISRQMLYVGGEWRDMVLTSLLREDFV